MDGTISAPPAFAVSRKRKRLHLIEDNSPEHQTSQLPSATGSQSSSFPSTSARRHHLHHDHHSSSPDERDQLVENPNARATSTTANTHHHRRRRSSSDMPRAGSDTPAGPSSGPGLLELPTSGLNRGFACMGCRKRKSKCDTNRPSCEQCLKAKTPCVYDDRPQKRPTEVLKDRIRDLEEKVRLLEQQNPGLAAALAKQQQQQQAAGAGPSSSGASGSSSSAASGSLQTKAFSQSQTWSTPPSTTGGPTYAYPPGTGGFLAPEQQRLPPSDIRSTSHSQTDPYYGTAAGQSIPGVSQFMLGRQGGPSIFAIAPDTSNDPLPPELDQMELLNTFIAHRHQAYCDLSYNRFMASLSVPHAPSSSSSSSAGNSHPNSPSQTNPSGLQRPHASLLNAAYLLGAFFSGSPHFAQYEPLFLHRARQGIAAALENAERLENAVQAASLVAVYLYAKGRVLEGYYLACANARFAMGCGMHKVSSPVWGIGGVTNPLNAGVGGAAEKGGDEDASGVNTMPLLEEPRDPIELGERIHIWWQVWMVDQCGAISTNLPPALSDTTDPLARIDTCFPPEMKDFEPGGSLSFVRRQSPHGRSPTMSSMGGEWNTLRSLYDSHSTSSMTAGGRNAMVAKAIELFSRAWKLSKHDVKDEYFRRAFEETDDAVRQFVATLPRNINHNSLFLPHSFALAAIIQLHWIIAVEHNNLHPSYQNCLNAATDMVSIIDIIQPNDYQNLELHIGMCWKLTTDVLYREWERVDALGDEDAAIYYQALAKVQEATRQLSRVFPVLTELWKISNS